MCLFSGCLAILVCGYVLRFFKLFGSDSSTFLKALFGWACCFGWWRILLGLHTELTSAGCRRSSDFAFSSAS